MNVPKELFAGDSATWEDDPKADRLGGAIDSSWTLKFVFSFATAVTITATTRGSGWTASLAKTDTSGLTAGTYYWQAYAEKTTRRETVGRGSIVIKPAAASGISGKTQNEQDLDAVELAIRTLVSNKAAEYTIGNRSFKSHQIGDLIVWRDRLKAMVRQEKKAERIANGLGNPSNVLVRFK